MLVAIIASKLLKYLMMRNLLGGDTFINGYVFRFILLKLIMFKVNLDYGSTNSINKEAKCERLALKNVSNTM